MIARLKPFLMKFARAIFARLKKIWRVWARARAIARHSRSGLDMVVICDFHYLYILDELPTSREKNFWLGVEDAIHFIAVKSCGHLPKINKERIHLYDIETMREYREYAKFQEKNDKRCRKLSNKLNLGGHLRNLIPANWSCFSHQRNLIPTKFSSHHNLFPLKYKLII